MTIDKIISIILTVASFVITVLIPTLIVWKKNKKALKNAKDEAERQEIINSILDETKNFVVSAEDMYRSVNDILKVQGVSVGALKKDKVMTSIQQLCIAKGLEYDADFWSEEVEKIVAMTKKVNSIN
ncbi:MAG: hypothetical protein ACI4MS_08255 [Candidatus Coproplasma sp.]